VLEISLDLSRFAVALHLLGMRLADIDDRPTVEMVFLDFGGSVPGARIRGIHWPPPFRRLGLGTRGGAG
jgi:hypothetical protein